MARQWPSPAVVEVTQSSGAKKALWGSQASVEVAARNIFIAQIETTVLMRWVVVAGGGDVKGGGQPQWPVTMAQEMMPPTTTDDKVVGIRCWKSFFHLKKNSFFII